MVGETMEDDGVGCAEKPRVAGMAWLGVDDDVGVLTLDCLWMP